MDLHATKTILETPVTPVLFLTSVGQPLEEVNESIIGGLTIVFGYASVGANVLQEVAQGRTVSKWKSPESFTCLGFTKLEWPTIGR